MATKPRQQDTFPENDPLGTSRRLRALCRSMQLTLVPLMMQDRAHETATLDYDVALVAFCSLVAEFYSEEEWQAIHKEAHKMLDKIGQRALGDMKRYR